MRVTRFRGGVMACKKSFYIRKGLEEALAAGEVEGTTPELLCNNAAALLVL